MARHAAVDPCMICGELPCICSGKVKNRKRASGPVARSTADRIQARLAAPADATRPRTAGTAAGTAVPVVSDTRSYTRDIEELVFEDCIRALEPLLSIFDHEKYRMILTSTPTPAEKAAVWKWRHANARKVS